MYKGTDQRKYFKFLEYWKWRKGFIFLRNLNPKCLHKWKIIRTKSMRPPEFGGTNTTEDNSKAPEKKVGTLVEKSVPWSILSSTWLGNFTFSTAAWSLSGEILSHRGFILGNTRYSTQWERDSVVETKRLRWSYSSHHPQSFSKNSGTDLIPNNYYPSKPWAWPWLKISKAFCFIPTEQEYMREKDSEIWLIGISVRAIPRFPTNHSTISTHVLISYVMPGL